MLHQLSQIFSALWAVWSLLQLLRFGVLLPSPQIWAGPVMQFIINMHWNCHCVTLRLGLNASISVLITSRLTTLWLERSRGEREDLEVKNYKWRKGSLKHLIYSAETHHVSKTLWNLHLRVIFVV